MSVGRLKGIGLLEAVLWVALAGLLVVTVGNHLRAREPSATPPDLPEFVPVFEFRHEDDPDEGLPPPVLCEDGRQATMPPQIPDDLEVYDVDTGERYPDAETFLDVSFGPGYTGQGRYRPTPEALCSRFPTVEPVRDGPPRTSWRNTPTAHASDITQVGSRT